MTVDDDKGKPMLFRYYDPRVLPPFMMTCNAQELKIIFGTVRYYFTESPDAAELVRFHLAHDKLNEATLDVDGQEYVGQTDSRGVLEQNIPANSRKGVLIIEPDELRLEIDFGYLDPINEIAGAKKHLNNMGYDCGEPNNKVDEKMQSQPRLFQKRFSLEET